MALTNEDIARVKGRGFLINRGTECFSGRVVAAGGLYTADALNALSECAAKYGNGTVAFTSRLCAEIVGIPFEKIEEAEAFLAERGLSFGGTGAKVRPVTGCKGTTCVYGNIDTQKYARLLHEECYIGMRSLKLPHKFKISVGGCPNSCMKPSLNDIGFEGCRPFEFDSEKCRGCKKCLCLEKCPSKALSRTDDGKTALTGKCLSCGVCAGKCPFGAIPKDSEARVRVYVGGTWGKTRRDGILLSKTISPDEIVATAQKAMLWYKENGLEKERFAITIARVGVEALEKAIFEGDLLSRRQEIFDMPVKTKA